MAKPFTINSLKRRIIQLSNDIKENNGGDFLERLTLLQMKALKFKVDQLSETLKILKDKLDRKLGLKIIENDIGKY